MFLLKVTFIYLFISWTVGDHALHSAYGDQRADYNDLVLSFTRWLPGIKLRPSDSAGSAFNCYAIPTSTRPMLLATMFTSSSSLGDFFFSFSNFQVVRKWVSGSWNQGVCYTAFLLDPLGRMYFLTSSSCPGSPSPFTRGHFSRHKAWHSNTFSLTPLPSSVDLGIPLGPPGESKILFPPHSPNLHLHSPSAR